MPSGGLLSTDMNVVAVEPGELGDWLQLGKEGYDNDGDGKVNEDTVGYVDPNRTWGFSWEPEYVQAGAGEARLLVVKAEGREWLIPFAAEYVKSFDVPGKRLEMALPQGMLELDAPLTEEEKREQRGEQTE